MTSTPTDSPAAAIKAFLITQGVFGDPTQSALVWPLYDGFMPDSDFVPDSAGSVADTSGVKQARQQIGENLFYYGFQVRVRSVKKIDAWAQMKKCVDAFEALNAWTNVTVGSHVYRIEDVTQVGSPLFLGTEPNTKRRVGYSTNFLVTMTQLS